MLLKELLQLCWEDLVPDPDDYILESTHILPVSVLSQYEQVSVAI
jgi:hypothetical protein